MLNIYELQGRGECRIVQELSKVDVMSRFRDNSWSLVVCKITLASAEENRVKRRNNNRVN